MIGQNVMSMKWCLELKLEFKKLELMLTIIDHMITEHVITEWPHEENKLLKKLGELNFGQVPNFQSMKPFRSWVKEEAKKVMKVNINSTTDH